MSEEEKRAIKEIKDILKYWQTIVDIEDYGLREIEMSLYCEEMPFNQMKILLNALDKKDKVIDLMAKEINKEYFEDIKANFYKKVEEEDVKD